MVAFAHLLDNQLRLFPTIFTAVSQAALIATVDQDTLIKRPLKIFSVIPNTFCIIFIEPDEMCT